MARRFHETLQEHGRVAERGCCFTGRSGDRVGERFSLTDGPHTAAAATERGLDQQGEADSRCGLLQLVGVEPGDVRRRCRRNAGRAEQRFRAELGAHRVDSRGGRPDPHQARRLDGTCEGRVLRQEAVAGMDTVRPRAQSRGDDQIAAQVGVGWRAAREPHGDIGFRHERRAGVVIAEHGNRAHPAGLGAAEDPAGDLAAVGHEHASQRPGSGHSRNTPNPSCTPRISSVWMAESAMPRTVLVSRGSMMPSS